MMNRDKTLSVLNNEEVEFLFKTLEAKGIDISLSGENLSVKSNIPNIPAELLEQIRANKSGIIDFLKRIEKRNTNELLIPRMSERASYPLSSTQKRIWFLSQLEKSNSAYNIIDIFELNGIIDETVLEKSIRSVINRHEILRTVFREDEQGTLQQFVLSPDAFSFELKKTDVSSEQAPNLIISKYITQERSTSFDLAKGPLVQFRLLKRSKDKAIFCCVIHHIISDGWSMAVFSNDLFSVYHAYRNSQDSPLLPLRIQYNDYVNMEYRDMEEDSKHQRYWINKFKGTLPVLELLGDYKRPAIKTYFGDTVTQKIDNEAYEKLEALCRSRSCSLFMGVFTLVQILLHKYTMQEDIIIGTVTAGRAHPELENQIGLYIKPLAIRLNIDPEDDFLSLIDQTKVATLEAYEHQQYPFDELVAALDLPKDRSKEPLFDVLVKSQNLKIAEDLLANIHSEELKISRYQEDLDLNPDANRVSKYDITFDFNERGKGLFLDIEYRTDLFKKGTIERLWSHFEQLLKSVLKNPERKIAALDYMNEVEKQVLLSSAVSQEIFLYPKDNTIIDLFEQQVKQKRAALAVVYGKTTYTYEVLNEKANQLGDYLRQTYQLEKDDLVGIKMEQSEKLILAILGVLKSGAAYVPLDPFTPVDRLAYILKDSKCKLILEEQELEAVEQTSTTYQKENLDKINSANDLAYVFYTSGTTGLPKGVMIEHSSLTLFFQNIPERFGMEKLERFGALTNFTFDISVLELLGTLVNGIAIEVFSDKDPSALIEAIEHKTIEGLQVTPSRLNQLFNLQANMLQVLAKLKVLLIGGEPLLPVQFEQLKTLKATKVLNVYGPTETTIWSTALALHGEEQLSIGTPLLGESIYILSKKNELLPIGLAGDIYIGGGGLARGYLNRPDLTTEKFIVHPFEEGKRLYKTGDVGRWLADGNIEFLGRRDDQVKIRGYRIELGEIENVLKLHPKINAVAVLVEQKEYEDKKLVAYIICEDDLNSTDIETYLLKKLPPYMLPAVYIRMEELPLNQSGKVDRKALKQLKKNILSTGVEYVAPESDFAKGVADLINDLLGTTKEIGMNDGFFTLGLTSIKMVSLLGKINSTFHLQLTLTDLFEYASLSSLQKRVEFLKHNAPNATSSSEEALMSEHIDDMITTMDEFIDALDD